MISVNGINYYDYDPERKLSFWLREDLSLTGTKIGCDIGVCGSCTVLVNGEPKLSCRLKLKDVENCNLITIEGIAVHEVPLTNTTFVHPSGVGVEVSEANILCNSPALTESKLHNKNRNKNIFFIKPYI